MAAFTLATKDTINEALGKTAGTNKKSSALEAIKELTKEVTALKKKNSQTSRGDIAGGGRGNRGGDTDGDGGNKKKRKYCGVTHLEKTPKVKCFERPENASKVPEWYKQAKAKRAKKTAKKATNS